MKQSELKSIIKEVVRECVAELKINEGGPQYKVMSTNQLDINMEDKARQIQYDPMVSESDSECEEPNGASESDEIKLIKALALITKKLMKMHNEHGVSEGNGVNKEASWKKVSKNETDTSKENKADKIQSDPKVSEQKVQGKSLRTSNDGDQIPKNVNDPKLA